MRVCVCGGAVPTMCLTKKDELVISFQKKSVVCNAVNVIRLGCPG